MNHFLWYIFVILGILVSVTQSTLSILNEHPDQYLFGKELYNDVISYSDYDCDNDHFIGLSVRTKPDWLNVTNVAPVEKFRKVYGGISTVHVIRQNNIVYAALVGTSMTVFNITNDTHLEEIGSIAGGLTYMISVDGDYVFMADVDWCLRVVDCSDPSSPLEVGTLDTNEGFNAIYCKNDFCYVSHSVAEIFDIINVTNKLDPVKAGNITGMASPGQIMLMTTENEEELAFVANGLQGLKIVNVTDKNNPTVELVYNQDVTEVVYVYVHDEFVYIVDMNEGLIILDFSIILSPVEVGRYSNLYYPLKLHVEGNYVFLADKNEGLKIFDVNDKSNPTLIGVIGTESETYGVTAYKNTIITAENFQGIRTIHFGDLETRSNIPEGESGTAAVVITVSSGGPNGFDDPVQTLEDEYELFFFSKELNFSIQPNDYPNKFEASHSGQSWNSDFTPVTGYPGPRYSSSSTSMDDPPRFFLWGGVFYDTSTFYADFWEYDLETGIWIFHGVAGQMNPDASSTATYPGAGTLPTLEFMNDGFIYLVGGYRTNNVGSKNVRADIWRINGTVIPDPVNWEYIDIGDYGEEDYNGKYSPSTPRIGGRYDHCTMTDGEDSIYIMGGYGRNKLGPGDGNLNDVWKLNLTDNTDKDTVHWEFLWPESDDYAQNDVGEYENVPLRPASRATQACWYSSEGGGSGTLNIFGGFSTTISGLANDLWKYEIDSSNWTFIDLRNDTSLAEKNQGKMDRDYPTLNPGEMHMMKSLFLDDRYAYIFYGEVENGSPDVVSSMIWKLDILQSQFLIIQDQEVLDSNTQLVLDGFMNNVPSARSGFEVAAILGTTNEIVFFGGLGKGKAGDDNVGTLGDLYFLPISDLQIQPTCYEEDFENSCGGSVAGYCAYWDTCVCEFEYSGDQCEEDALNYFELVKDNPTPEVTGNYTCLEEFSFPGGRSRLGGAIFGSLGNEKLYIFGGYGIVENDDVRGHLSDLWYFDTEEKLWCFVKGSTEVDVVENSFGASSSQVFDEGHYPGSRSSFGYFWTSFSFFIFGGQKSGVYNLIHSTEEYSPATSTSSYNDTNEVWEVFVGTEGSSSHNQWRLLMSEDEDAQIQQPTKRSYPCVSQGSNNNDLVYIFGGGSKGIIMNDLWTYDIQTNNFSLIKGEFTSYPNTSFNSTQYFSGLSKLDYQVWLNPSPRIEHICWCSSGSNNFFVFGGTLQDGKSSNDIWIFNSTEMNWAWICGGDGDPNSVITTPFEYDSTNIPSPRSSAYVFRNSPTLEIEGGTDGVMFFGGVHFSSQFQIEFSSTVDYNTPGGDTYSDVWSFSTTLMQFKFVNGSGMDLPNQVGTLENIGSRFGGIASMLKNQGFLIFGGEE